MRNPYLFSFFFISLILIIDFYSYRGLKKLWTNYSIKVQRILWWLFWIVPIILITGFGIFAIFYSSINPADFLRYFHYISGMFILFYVPKIVFNIFNMFDDLILLVKKIISKRKEAVDAVDKKGAPISRGQFLTRVGLVTAGIPFISIAYGIKWGRFDFTIRNHSLQFANLPKAFDGLKVVQISDFHIGSFMSNIEKVEEAVEIINDQNPDLLLFTGDFVNNVSSEIDNFLPILKKLKANVDKFSILGNHDYGEYVPWKTEEDKQNNIKRIIELQKEIGFNMILNSSQKVNINSEEIEIVGVENWGLPPFPQYGDLKKAMSNTNPEAFKILLSHDPTHWDEQVMGHTNIDLTLSGHTHGAQFGIDIPGVRWSPVTVRYKRWGGMYQEGNQYLNVNTGIGFIGFPGRVGMPPEISVIELRRAVS
jgi:predicted MPP superfamily phosphohydrolase